MSTPQMFWGAPSENVPALIGIPGMAATGAVIDCKAGNVILPGPGGLEVRASPGTTEVQMHRDTHWLLGVSSPKDHVRASSAPPRTWTRTENKSLKCMSGFETRSGLENPGFNFCD